MTPPTEFACVTCHGGEQRSKEKASHRNKQDGQTSSPCCPKGCGDDVDEKSTVGLNEAREELKNFIRCNDASVLGVPPRTNAQEKKEKKDGLQEEPRIGNNSPYLSEGLVTVICEISDARSSKIIE